MYEIKKSKVEGKINDRGHYKVADFTVNGYMYGFNVDYLPEDQHEWFLGVVSRTLEQVDATARAETVSDMQSKFRSLIGVSW